METFQQRRQEAEKRLKVADHLLTVTHPMIKDPKILLTVLQNLCISYDEGMTSVLEYEKKQRSIPAVPESFLQKHRVFQKVAPKHRIPPAQIENILKLREIVGLHKKSPIEVKKGNKFVMFDDKYRSETLTEEFLKGEVSKARKFVEMVNEVTG